jgi:exonuclease SbcC
VGERKEARQALARLDREVGRAAAAEEEAADRARLAGRVAQVAAGRHGEEGMSFHRWVLAAMLEEVVQAAGRRFDRMSRGRYRFERAREREKRRRKGGLDLNVIDAWSGRSRPVATLSGGEGFLAALSLTLGLAEIVHNRVGGTRMEALFIDEGFGSLDQEALDAALVSLQELRETERLVGVISHVPELCERIPVRLEVVKRTDRSTLNHVT